MLDVLCFVVFVQLLQWLSGKESACNAEATGDRRVWSLGQEDFLEEEMATHSRILPGESHGQRSLVGDSPWGRKESDATEATDWFDILAVQGTLKSSPAPQFKSISSLVHGPTLTSIHDSWQNHRFDYSKV